MLSKVLKYDIKHMLKMLFPLYLITIVMCILARLFYAVEGKSIFFEYMSFITKTSGIILLVGTAVFTFITMARRFYTNLFKDEGYLTNTLPVAINTHILSKFICSLIFTSLAILIVIGSVSIMYYDLIGYTHIFSFLDVFGGNIIYGILLIILSFQAYQMIIWTAYALGQRTDRNKIATSFVYGIILYFCVQMVALVVLGIGYLINNNIIELLATTTLGAIITNVIQIINILIYYGVISWALNNKMDLE